MSNDYCHDRTFGIEFNTDNEYIIDMDGDCSGDLPLNVDSFIEIAENNHDRLANRDLPDQHPMSAITGLEDALAGKVDNNWGSENSGKFLKIDDDGSVIATEQEGSDKYFIFNQNVASNEWDIQHNLNKRPSVTVVDSAGTVVVGEVLYISDNQLKVTFQGAFSGKAYLN